MPWRGFSIAWPAQAFCLSPTPLEEYPMKLQDLKKVVKKAMAVSSAPAAVSPAASTAVGAYDKLPGLYLYP
jgi:hypothetical protein